MHCDLRKKVCKMKRNRVSRMQKVSNLKGMTWLLKYNWTRHCGNGKVLKRFFKMWQTKISRGYKEKLRRKAFRQSHNIRKDVKVVECRMSNEDRRLHEKMQKNIFSHTKYCCAEIERYCKHQ